MYSLTFAYVKAYDSVVSSYSSQPAVEGRDIVSWVFYFFQPPAILPENVLCCEGSKENIAIVTKKDGRGASAIKNMLARPATFERRSLVPF